MLNLFRSLLKKLTYVKSLQIEIGKNDTQLQKDQKVKKDAPLKFEELADMSYQSRDKILETYSIKQLENLICSAKTYPINEEDRELFKDIMIERYRRIRHKFKWTEENNKRIAKVSDEFLKAWEESYLKAKMIIETLYEKDNKSFNDKYIIEIKLHPEFLFDDNDDSDEWKMYDVITRYLNSDIDLSMTIKYDPVTKNDDDFRQNGHIKRDLSWNIEGFGDIDLEGYHTCYALHALYSHNDWAFSDIPKINNINTEIKVGYDGERF